MEYPGVVPSVFLVFKGLALVTECLCVVDVKECSTCADWDDVIDIGSLAVASSAIRVELQAFGSDVCPFGMVLPQGSRVCRWIPPWFALVLVTASLMRSFAAASCEGASCLWSCRHQSVTSIPSRVKALRKSSS